MQRMESDSGSSYTACLPPALPGFETIRRYVSAAGMPTARILPGEYYVTCEDEMLDTVLGSCVSACIRNPHRGIGGMNHFMLPRPAGGGGDTWDSVAGRAMRYGSASMEQLINRILGAGGTRKELEVKIFGGGCVLASLTDIGTYNVCFVRDFLRQEGLTVLSESVGSTYSRHVQYFPRSGRARVRHLNSTRNHDVASHEQQYLRGLEQVPIAGEIDLF
jgi:chemotaxis protein CheD